MVGAIYAPEIMSLVRLPENGAARILMLTKGALAAEAWVFSQPVYPVLLKRNG